VLEFGLSCMASVASIFKFINYLGHRCKKQDEEELNKKTFYNIGLYSDNDHPCLLEKMQSPLFKKAFEEGRKAKKSAPHS